MNTRESAGGKSRHSSLRWRMLGVFLLCWMIPFAFLIGIPGVYLAGSHSDMKAESFRDQLEFINRICVERLNGVLLASREASYDGVLLGTYEDYRAGRTSYVAASRAYKEYLSQKYLKNNAISSAILWFYEEQEQAAAAAAAPGEAPAEGTVYSVYNEHAGGSYQQIRSYLENDHLIVKTEAGRLETRARFLKRGRALYLIRNLVDARFEPRGALIFCLNRDYCLESAGEYAMADSVYMEIEGQPVWIHAQELLEKWESRGQKPPEGYEWSGNRLYVTADQKGDGYALHTSMLLQEEITRYPFYGYPYVLGAMVLSLVLMLLLMLYVFRKQVTEPVEMLIAGARRIEEGELGVQLEGGAANAEFYYLRDSFNQMSAHLRQQFDRIYQEEVALREARIMALQSHINPHFLNNTLEIINWEARMEGNLRVCRMIGALSTMLDAAMDRRGRPQVRLAEEMVYVRSYLYITKERLGQRLRIETEIPEELMDYLVPRLILQPVIENAIEHGVVPNGSGVVTLRGRSQDGFLYLETVNDGGLSAKDQESIARLLDPDYNPKYESSGNLGIANVNQRLRILFGDPCGLSITENGQGKVVAKLTMPLRKWEADSVEMNKTGQ